MGLLIHTRPRAFLLALTIASQASCIGASESYE